MPRPNFASHLSLKRLYHSNNSSRTDLDGQATPGSTTNGNRSPTTMKEHAEKPAVLSLQINVLKVRRLARETGSSKG